MNISDLYGARIKNKFSGAGVIPFCKSTGRYMLCQRSGGVKLPWTWAGFGGEIDPGESPEVAAVREMYEEAGFAGTIKLKLVYKYDEPKFEYFNFIGTVTKEFEAKLNWENVDAQWFAKDEWPENLHPGIQKMLQHWTPE